MAGNELDGSSFEPENSEKKGNQEVSKGLIKFLQKVLLTNPFIIIIDLINIVVFIFSVIKDCFYISLIVILCSLGMAFLLFLLRNSIYSYVNNKLKDKLNPRDVRKWIEDFSLVQIMFFILLLCSYLLIVRQNYPDRYYDEMNNFLGPVIETKIATISPTNTGTPKIKATIKPTITLTPTITPTFTYTPEPEEYQVSVFIDNMFQNLDRYFNDRNLEDEIDLPHYFCVEEGKALTKFLDNFVNRIISNYSNGNSKFEIDCVTEIDPSRIYDRGNYWYVEFENKCDIACPMAIYNDVEYLISVDMLKPNEYRNNYCINDFDLILSKN